MSVIINGTTGITSSGDLALDNGSADGAQVTLASSGYSNWNLDNYSGRFRAYYNATEYFTINSSGNVGIGTSTTTGGKTTIQTTSSAAPGGVALLLSDSTGSSANQFGIAFNSNVAGNSGSARLNYYVDAGGAAAGLTFLTGGATPTEKMRIDSSGNVGIGTTSMYTTVNVARGAGINASIEFAANGNTLGTNSCFYGQDTSSNAYVYNRASAPVIFGTSNTERMRIDSSGNVLVGTSDANANTGVGFKVLASTTDPSTSLVTNVTTNNAHWMLFNTNATNNGFRFYVTTNGGIANYQANNANLSDERLKTDVTPAKSYLDTICSIPVVTFKYKDQNDDELNLGVIAQSVDAVAPELVDHSGFGEAPEGEDPYLAVYQTDLQYALMKCIQEQQELIKSLTTRIETLEAK